MTPNKQGTNMCDGCQRGLPLKDGFHTEEVKRGDNNYQHYSMVYTADRYKQGTEKCEYCKNNHTKDMTCKPLVDSVISSQGDTPEDIELNIILAGIDEEETTSKMGWWETSTGAEFGRKKKVEIKALIHKLQQEAWEKGVAVALQGASIHQLGDMTIEQCKHVLQMQCREQERQEIVDAIEKRETNYPEEIFSSPPKDFQKELDEWAKSQGYRIDNISAYFARWQEKIVKEDIVKFITQRGTKS